MGECYCLYYGDAEYPEVYRENERTAKFRSHECSECHNPIEIGNKYVEINGVWNGHWSRYKFCIICRNIAIEYFPCGYIFGELRSMMYEHFGVDICGEWPVNERVR